MNVIDKKLNELIPYEKNPRKNDEAVKYVMKSIKEFGFKVPIVIDKNNVIVCGHTRYKASKKLKLDTVPCIIADDLTEEQIKAYRLADNKVSEKAEWDFDLLNNELNDIFEFDMQEFGFEFEDDEEKPTQEVIEDEVPDVPEEPKAKMGDIYQLGNHRLMCGDSTSKDDVNKLLDGARIDMVLTDPPYGISIVNNKGKVGAENLAKNRTYLEVKGDDTTDTAEKSYQIMKDVSKNQIIFGGNYFVNFLPFSPSWLIWDKRVNMTSNNFADGEMAWCSFNTPVRIYKQLWNGMIREGEHDDRVHPTQKPVRMLGEILKDFTEQENTILDLFGGSGSTLMACEQLNRQCYMMEYEPHYIDVIIKRWEKFTGKKAELLKEEN